MSNLKWFLYFLVRPRWWFRNYPVSEAWDAKLNSLMDNNVKVERESKYTVKLGKTIVWVHNYPYAYGAWYITDPLPRRRTAVRLSYYIEGVEL